MGCHSNSEKISVTGRSNLFHRITSPPGKSANVTTSAPALSEPEGRPQAVLVAGVTSQAVGARHMQILYQCLAPE